MIARRQRVYSFFHVLFFFRSYHAAGQLHNLDSPECVSLVSFVVDAVHWFDCRWSCFFQHPPPRILSLCMALSLCLWFGEWPTYSAPLLPTMLLLLVSACVCLCFRHYGMSASEAIPRRKATHTPQKTEHAKRHSRQGGGGATDEREESLRNDFDDAVLWRVQALSEWRQRVTVLPALSLPCTGSLLLGCALTQVRNRWSVSPRVPPPFLPCVVTRRKHTTHAQRAQRVPSLRLLFVRLSRVLHSTFFTACAPASTSHTHLNVLMRQHDLARNGWRILFDSPRSARAPHGCPGLSPTWQRPAYGSTV